MRLIDADAFRREIDNHWPFTKEEQSKHGIADMAKGTLLYVLNCMPAIEPQRWVPVTERLPEEDGEYLVACSTAKGKPCVHDIETFANDLYQVDKYKFSDKKGQKGWAYLHDEYRYIEDQTVVAWMPLPEPYKEDHDERE